MDNNNSGSGLESESLVKIESEMELPPGFRFHPTDEELITYYLSKKVIDRSFAAIAIVEVDMNRVEPWELPWRSRIGEKEWYFFCLRDKKYPTGLRTNRATATGYWKATGKDKEIFRGRSLVGMKKTLVFYHGRAPKGQKSNWVSHEYRLDGELSLRNLTKTAKNDWVISRVFQKTANGKKVHISGLVRMKPAEIGPEAKYEESKSGHVHCFSSSMEHTFSSSSTPLDSFPSSSGLEFYWRHLPPIQTSLPGPMSLHDPLFPRTFLPNYVQNVSISQEAALSNENSSGVLNPGHEDLDCIWNY